MNYAVCCVPVAPIRIDTDHKSEMVSQLLFGECCIINDSDTKGWVNISCKADGYVGCCQAVHMQQITMEDYYSGDIILSGDWVNEISFNNNSMQIPLGSLINLKNNVIQFTGNKIMPGEIKNDAASIQKIAFKFLNTAYLWGGRSVFGIDCSGFAQAVYKFLNIPLLRDADLQVTQGEMVDFLQEAQCGDLAFFDDEEGKIVHVGILLNSHEIIHASGKVRVDKIDNQGIVHAETGERTHQLRIIKRFF
jgi:gamma-D-glutamyl-L-lysine dipeptidyl-peptidase